MLQLQEASFWYDTKDAPVVYRCSFRLQPNQFAAVVGSSGSGKSTLLKLASGLIRDEIHDKQRSQSRISGSVKWKDQDVACPLPEFSYIPQNFSNALMPALTAEGNIMMAARRRGKSKQGSRALCDRLMEQCSISEQAHCNVRLLSGGQQQRVAFCRALLSEPEVVFMDEPFANLDEKLKPEMTDLLDQLRTSRPMSVLLVTHDVKHALAVADVILHVDTTLGFPRYEVLQDPKNNPEGAQKAIESWIA